MTSGIEFQEWFCLGDRLSFTIDPLSIPEDARFYFGRKETKKELMDQMRRSFVTPGIPKMMIFGPYGSGKTHTLLHLEYVLKHDPPRSIKRMPHTVYAIIEMRSNSDARHLHAQMLEALGRGAVAEWASDLADKSQNLDEAMSDLTDDFNIRAALKEVRIPGPLGLSAWRWMTGQTLKTAELDSLQITRNLGDVSTGDLAEALIAIGSLAKTADKTLIFFLDELEGLSNVRVGDNADSITQYIRRLSEPGNSSVGFVLGFFASIRDDVPLIINRGEIRTRIGESNYLEIGALPAVADVKEFIRSMAKDLTDSECVGKKIESQKSKLKGGQYPLSKDAIDTLADYATQEPTQALPRLIIHAQNESAIQAWDEGEELISAEMIHKIAPSVFEVIF